MCAYKTSYPIGCSLPNIPEYVMAYVEYKCAFSLTHPLTPTRDHPHTHTLTRTFTHSLDTQIRPHAIRLCVRTQRATAVVRATWAFGDTFIASELRVHVEVSLLVRGPKEVAVELVV